MPDGGRRSLFLGAYANHGVIDANGYLRRFPGNPIARFEGNGKTGTAEGHWHYDLEPAPLLVSLRKRLVVDWDAGTRKWDQSRLNKPVLEIRTPDHAEGFTDYSDVHLGFPDLKQIVQK